MESVDRLEAYVSQYSCQHNVPTIEKAITRELKHIYTGASVSPEELYPTVYHLLVEVLHLGSTKLSQLALRVLSRLCWNSPVNRARCVTDADRMGLPELLVTILEDSGTSERLAAQATRFTTVIITQAWRDASEGPGVPVPVPYCSTMMLRALVVAFKQHHANPDIFVHTCFCIYGFIQYHSKRGPSDDDDETLRQGIEMLRESDIVGIVLEGLKKHHLVDKMSGFAGVQVLQVFFSHRNADSYLTDADDLMIQEATELILRVMCINTGHSGTYKHCVLLLQTLLASARYSEKCKSTLSECPHLQRALVAARDALRDKTITPEMVLGKQLVPEALGENTRAALMRVEADDDNTVYCTLICLARVFGVELD